MLGFQARQLTPAHLLPFALPSWPWRSSVGLELADTGVRVFPNAALNHHST